MRRVVMLMLATVLFPLMSCTVGRMDALYLATSTPQIQVLDPDTGEPLENASGGYVFSAAGLYETVTKTFTVKNQGELSLLIKKLYFTKDEHVDFMLDSRFTETTVQTGGSTEFSVSFKPNVTGDTFVSLIIENNDPGDRLFVLNLAGSGTPGLAPPVVSIPQVADGGEYDFGLVDSGYTSTQTFTIQNSGGADLSIISVYPTGEDSTSFNVLPPREASIPADSTTDFKIAFSPQETGSYNATINIRTDDPDTPLYTFSVQGEGQVPDPPAEAEINLRRGAVDIPSGTLGYDFTSVEANIADPPRVTFTIENKGENPLFVSGPLVDGDTVFTTIPDTLVPTLFARETYDFQIQFLPETNSTYSATVNISNNDNDENPYTFRVDGKGVTGSVPDISVWSEGREVPDGTVYDFGYCRVGKNKSRSFIVKNLGTADLQVSPPLIVAGKDFSQDMTSPAAVPPGGLHELTVAFQPGEIGTSTAKMLIRNNDADENPYIINLAGQGTD